MIRKASGKEIDSGSSDSDVEISGLFSEPGCSIRTARGTKNFDFIFIFFWQPVQIHIHVHMHLAGTSMCQRCLLPDEIPSAPNSPS